MRRFWWVLAWFLGLAGSAPAIAASPPVEVFFDAPAITSAWLSPSGRWLATSVRGANGRIQLAVSDLDDKVPARIVATFSRVDVNEVQWVNDDWLVFDTRDEVDRSGQWKGAGLLAVRRDGEQLRLLIRRNFAGFVQMTGIGPLDVNHELLALGDTEKSEIIVGEHVFDVAGELSHVRPLALNVATGERRSLLKQVPERTRDWLFDSLGRPRVAVAFRDGRYEIHWFDLATQDWKRILESKGIEPPWWPQHVEDSGRLIASTNDGQGYGELRAVNTATGQLAAEALVQTPGFSGAARPLHGPGGVVWGYATHTDARAQAWIRPELAKVQAKVNEALPGRVNLIQPCQRCARVGRVLVHSWSDRDPGEFLILDADADRWQRLGPARPKVDPARMATMEFHRAKARDGADLPLWVTLPPDRGAKPGPTVVLVHGGPWRRGATWAWRSEAQFLASRGYVVVEPEFRGSTGYGYRHFRAGWRQWGQAMQDDVADALKFAVDKGWSDGKRACIAGMSYGGYAALMGLVRHPEQYKCAVAGMAPTDPRLMYTVHWSDISTDAKQFTMPQMIGDLEKDAAMLTENAPLEQATRIKAPVLLAYGSLDMRVPIVHGERMRDALRNRGQAPEWVVYPDEGHGFRRTDNEVDFWKRVETFLAKHLN